MCVCGGVCGEVSVGVCGCWEVGVSVGRWVWVLGGGCKCGKVGLGMERWCVWEDVYH